MRQCFRGVYSAVLALRREYSIMALAVSSNYRTQLSMLAWNSPAQMFGSAGSSKLTA